MPHSLWGRVWDSPSPQQVPVFKFRRLRLSADLYVDTAKQNEKVIEVMSWFALLFSTSYVLSTQFSQSGHEYFQRVTFPERQKTKSARARQGEEISRLIKPRPEFFTLHRCGGGAVPFPGKNIQYINGGSPFRLMGVLSLSLEPEGYSTLRHSSVHSVQVI